MLTVYVFYFLSILAIFGAVMTIFATKPVYNVLYLTLTLFAIGGHYILLNAQFLAIVHIIVYTGAVMVLFLFTVMLLNLSPEIRHRRPFLMKLSAVVAGGIFLMVMVAAFRNTDALMLARPELAGTGLVKNLGKVLYNEYLVPFELSSVLFLAAMVGAVLLGKKEL